MDSLDNIDTDICHEHSRYFIVIVCTFSEAAEDEEESLKKII